MVSADIAKVALELPAEERIELARQLVESVVAPDSLAESLSEGFRRVEDLASGRVRGMTEEEFRALERRTEELAGKSTESQLTESERAEYAGYVRANKSVAVLQRQARQLRGKSS